MSWNSSGFIGLQPFLYLKSAYSDNTSLQSACLLALTAEAAQRNYRGEVEVLSCWYQLRSSPKTAKHGPAAVGASKQNNGMHMLRIFHQKAGKLRTIQHYSVSLSLQKRVVFLSTCRIMHRHISLILIPALIYTNTSIVTFFYSP